MRSSGGGARGEAGSTRTNSTDAARFREVSFQSVPGIACQLGKRCTGRIPVCTRSGYSYRRVYFAAKTLRARASRKIAVDTGITAFEETAATASKFQIVAIGISAGVYRFTTLATNNIHATRSFTLKVVALNVWCEILTIGTMDARIVVLPVFSAGGWIAANAVRTSRTSPAANQFRVGFQ